MDKTEFIEIRIKGSNGTIELSTDNYDIAEIVTVLQSAENLLFPGNKRDRPTISYRIEDGSVRHIFRTSRQYVAGFNTMLLLIASQQNIDILESPGAQAFEEFQRQAQQKNYTFEIRTSLSDSPVVRIDRTTDLRRTVKEWADAEFYFYGKVTNAGGKDKANIHIATADHGIIRIDTPISFLEHREDNLLYRSFGVRATGRQNVGTGEIDLSSLKFIELIDYEPRYDERYLERLRKKAQHHWQGTNADEWLRSVRGSYDA